MSERKKEGKKVLDGTIQRLSLRPNISIPDNVESTTMTALDWDDSWNEAFLCTWSDGWSDSWSDSWSDAV